MLTHPQFDPVALDLGLVQIHWYGLMYLLAFLAAFTLAKKLAREGRAPFLAEQVDDIIFYGALGVILGGRIGYVFFYSFDNFLADPLTLFKVWQGGMSFHGGFLGVLLAMFLYCRKYAIPLGALFDITAVIVPPGLGFGRIGNFIGQELWGRASDVPWAMVFPKDPSGFARHPSQLYQATLEGLVIFLVVFWFIQKPRPRWAAAALFALLYGIFRFIVEFFRQPDAHIGFDAFGFLSRGQLLSLPMIMIGLGVFIWAYKNNKPTDFDAIQKRQKKLVENQNKAKKAK